MVFPDWVVAADCWASAGKENNSRTLPTIESTWTRTNLRQLTLTLVYRLKLLPRRVTSSSARLRTNSWLK